MPATHSLLPGLVVDTLIGADAHPLVVVVGPTASGKSGLAVRIASAFGGEIVNFDSVQVYRGFDVGSGKLPLAERAGIPHHLVDLVEPGATFTAGDYRREGLRVLEAVRSRGNLPILVGGSGLYLRALLLGLFSGPRRSEGLRRRLHELAERRGRAFLHRLLLRKDPASAARIHARDTQKVIRALEVCFLTRQAFSTLLEQGREGLAGFQALKVGLNPPRAELYRRIDARVEEMFSGGLVDEVRTALANAEGARMAPLEALGYRQALAFIEGKMNLEDAIRDAQAATRQYAKRQLTWFRREPNVRWFEGFGDDPSVEREVLESLESVFPASRLNRPVLASSFN
ncbi:MAG TPA: tRNA (adenosine(37)-N6)-dimethylallyltransferase MiaA [Terriglobia bacterium]|nr:tRNA (adenosine(37)-N6)-dimethylallyltransferase MiaA [Terriglobia bacterium]